MLNKRQIAALATATVAWGAFAMTVGTTDTGQYRTDSIEHAPSAPAGADNVAPRSAASSSTGTAMNIVADAERGLADDTADDTQVDPAGPLAFEDTHGNAVAASYAATPPSDIEPSRNRMLVAELMRESVVEQTTVDVAIDLTQTDLSLSVGSLPTLAVGETGEIELVLRNEGPGVATTELIAYDLPQGVELAAAGPNGCTVEDGQVLCWVATTIDAGAQTLVTIPVMIVETESDADEISDGWAGIVVSETVDPNSDNDSVSVAPHRPADSTIDPALDR